MLMTSNNAINAGLSSPRKVAGNDMPKEVYVAVLPDPNGGWGGPPYPQLCGRDTEGARRYVLEE